MIIYATGCAKSGTTLMQNLMSTGFEDVQYVRLQDRRKTLKKPPDGKHLCLKCKTNAVERLLNTSGNNVGFVWVVWHPYGLLLSRSVASGFEGYHNSAQAVADSFIRLKALSDDPRIIVIKFEALVRKPLVTQREIAKFFGLRQKRPFTECHPHFDMKDIEAPALKGARPPDRSRIEPWNAGLSRNERGRLNTSLQLFPDLFEEMEQLGYDSAVKDVNILAIDKHKRATEEKKAKKANKKAPKATPKRTAKKADVSRRK